MFSVLFDTPIASMGASVNIASTLCFYVDVDCHLCDDAKPGSDGMLLQWTTGMESELLGFFILRQDDSGAWRILNSEMIAAQQAGQAQGATYQWTDPTPPPSRHLRYKLGLVTTTGQTVYHDLGEIAMGQPLYLPLIRR